MPDEVVRIGILGGTFDPPHIGHLILAEEAWALLHLERVYLVPAGDPPHKRGMRLSPAYHRRRMVEMSIADNPHFLLSTVDIDRPGPHYTVDMVRLLRAALPGNSELYFLMGADSLADLPNWHRPDLLIASCRLVAMSRPGYPVDWEMLEVALPGVRERVIQLDMPELEIASHVIQRRVRQGLPIRYQVLPAVEEYIRQQGLYSEQ
jgi:nicotinate-nucleotide adenylyltransferase